MKKLFFIFVVFSSLALFACSKKSSGVIENNLLQNNGPVSSVSVIPTEEQYLEMAAIPLPSELQKEAEGIDLNAPVDLDLTTMSSTMIYAQVFNMVLMPEEFENQNIKIKGNFAVYINKENGERYFAVIIPDATECCQQGIEFIWAGNHTYPQDYPKIGQEIEVTGFYKATESESGLMYNYLQCSELKAL